MRLPLLLLLALSAACSQAQPDKVVSNDVRPRDAAAANAIPGLQAVGSIKGTVPESSALIEAPTPKTYYSIGDDGNTPTLYTIGVTGKLQGKTELKTQNIDWESLARDEAGNYFIGDCGNNNSVRTDLRILRFRPEAPDDVSVIAFTYPDQTEFPPKKKARNFDCEAILWHENQILLFTKDRGLGTTSKVYTLPDQPGQYVAKPLTKLAIPGEVTDAALSPSGRRLVLLGRGELFILDGSRWDRLLKDTPLHVSLGEIGQTEGVTFKDEKTLLISTENGGLFQYRFQ